MFLKEFRNSIIFCSVWAPSIVNAFMTANMDDIRLFHIIMSEVKIGVFSSALAPCSLTLSQGLRSMTSHSVAVFSINEKTLTFTVNGYIIKENKPLTVKTRR